MKVNEPYRKKMMYTMTHYFHLLKSMTGAGDSELFNFHLCQSMIHEIFEEELLLQLMVSPLVNGNYIYMVDDAQKGILEDLRKNIQFENKKIHFHDHNRCFHNLEESSSDESSEYQSDIDDDVDVDSVLNIAHSVAVERVERVERVQEEEEKKKSENAMLYEYFSSSKSPQYEEYHASSLLRIVCMKRYDKVALYLLKRVDGCVSESELDILRICCENELQESSKYLISHIYSSDESKNKSKSSERKSKSSGREMCEIWMICCKNKHLEDQALLIFESSKHDLKMTTPWSCRSRSALDHSGQMIEPSELKDIMEDGLGYAAKHNMKRMVQSILENETDLRVDRLNRCVNNPLYWCAFHKNEDALLRLLNYKNININVKEKDQDYDLFEVVCRKKMVRIALHMLCTKHEFIHFKGNVDGSSPFYYACVAGLEEVALKILEATDYKITCDVRMNRTSLYHACLKNMDQVIYHILSSKSLSLEYLNCTDCVDMNNAFLLCCKARNEDRALQMIEIAKCMSGSVSVSVSGTCAGTEFLYMLNRKKKSPLYYACKYEMKRLIPLLLRLKILYTPFFDKKIKKYIEPSCTKEGDSKCNICYDDDGKEGVNGNYLFKCEKCVGLFHARCIHSYFQTGAINRCPHCRERSTFVLI